MLLNEWLKLIVRRHRPFVDGWFVDWSGYSFASGHTIGATLLYGQLALFIVPLLKKIYLRRAVVAMAVAFVLIVGFSRIALGAHYFTDVLGGIILGNLWLSFCLLVGRPMRRIWRASENALPASELLLIPLEVATEPIRPHKLETT